MTLSHNSTTTQAPHAISKVMRHVELGRQEAFDWLIRHRLLHIGTRFAVVDMRAVTAEVVMELAKNGDR